MLNYVTGFLHRQIKGVIELGMCAYRRDYAMRIVCIECDLSLALIPDRIRSMASINKYPQAMWYMHLVQGIAIYYTLASGRK
jgi:hypothetical protein